MAFTRVQYSSFTSTANKATGDSWTLTGGNAVSGNILVFAAGVRPGDYSGDAPVLTVTDNSGGGYTWNQVGTQRSTTNHTGGLWWRIVQPGETTCSTLLTATYSSSASMSAHGVLYEYSSDVGGTLSLEASGGNANTGSVSSIATSSALSVQDGDLVIGYGSIRTTASLSPSSPLSTVIGNPGPAGWSVTDGEYFPTSTTTVTPTITGATASAWIVAGVWRDTAGGVTGTASGTVSVAGPASGTVTDTVVTGTASGTVSVAGPASGSASTPASYWTDTFNYTDSAGLNASNSEWTETSASFTIYNPSGESKVYSFGTGYATRESLPAVRFDTNMELFYGADLQVGIVVGYADTNNYLMWEINVNSTPGENKIGLYLKDGPASFTYLYEDTGGSFASGQFPELGLELNGTSVRAYLDGVEQTGGITLTSGQIAGLGTDVGLLASKGGSAWLDATTSEPAVYGTAAGTISVAAPAAGTVTDTTITGTAAGTISVAGPASGSAADPGVNNLKYGAVDVDAVYIGSSLVDAIYYGSVQVF